MKEFKKQIFQKNKHIVMFGSNFLDKIYLIVKGTAKKEFMGKTYDLKQGQFINLISVLCGRTNITSVRSTSELEVIVIPVEKLSLLLKYDSIILNMFLETSFYLKDILYRCLNLLEEENKEFKKINHKDSLFNLGKYLLNKKLYIRSEYVFNQLLEYYPNNEFMEDINNYINQIKKHNPNQTINQSKTFYKKNEPIYSQFEKDNKMIFLKRGEVKFFLYNYSHEYYVETMQAKTFFGQMSFHSKVRNLSCISTSDETEVLFIEYKQLINVIKNQENTLLLNIIKQFAQRIWKALMLLEHLQTFSHSKNNLDNYHRICDILYTFYEVQNGKEKNSTKNSFNFKITIEELFRSTNFPNSAKIDDIFEIIKKTPFLSINEKGEVVCEDIRFLNASCYGIRKEKNQMRHKNINL